MSNSIRALAIVLAAALGSLVIPFGASAVALPIYQMSANIEQISNNGNIQRVAAPNRWIYLRNRQGHFRPSTFGNHPRYRYLRDRDRHRRHFRDGRWGYGDPRARYWRYRHGRFHDWRRHRHNRFHFGTYWGVDPWWDYDPPVIVAPTVSYDRSAHVEWCLDHYRSYDPRTNTWIGYSGRVYQCDSPYDWR